jgi:hypothetical protein
VDVGKLARIGDFAEDEERSVGVDLDRDLGLAQEAGAQLALDRPFELLRGPALRLDGVVSGIAIRPEPSTA